MAKDSSFDIVSQVDMPEVDNALNQTEKEITQRFDFKGSNTEIIRKEGEIIITTSDDFKLRNVIDVLQGKLAKREVPLKNLEYLKVESSLGGRVKQVIKLKQGISKEDAKKIQALIKDSKLKVQSALNDDVIRVSAKDKDNLQDVIQLIRGADLPISVQFINYR